MQIRMDTLVHRGLAAIVTIGASSMALHLPAAAKGSSSSSSSSRSSYSYGGTRSYSSSTGRSYSSSGRIVSIGSASGHTYTPRQIRAQYLQGSLRNVRTISGAPLVIRAANGSTYVDGRRWQPGPVRMIRARVIDSRVTAYYTQPTFLVRRGRPYVLDDGPRLGNTHYWRSDRDVSHDEFWWSYFAASNDWIIDPYHPFGWYMPFTAGWYGHELGEAARDSITWPPFHVVDTPTPTIAFAGQRTACAGYRDLAGNSLGSISVWTVDNRCPAENNPPNDARFPSPVAFCEIEDDAGTHLVVPIAQGACPHAPPPALTPDDDLTIEDDQ